MSEWRECKLGEAPLEIIDGDRGKHYPSQNEFYSTGYCLFLSTKNVRTNGFDFSDCQYITKQKDEILRKGRLQKNDIVLTTRGTVGNIGFFDNSVFFENIRINSGMVIIRPDCTQIAPAFNFYLFRKLQNDFHTFSSGTAQPQLPIRDMKEMEISLPPLEEQKAIAEVLSGLDDKIDLLHRQNRTLESLAQTLFRQWFIEEAKDEWEEKTVGDIAILKSGKSRPKEESEINNVPIYGGNGILGFTNQHNIDGETIIIGRVGAYCGSLYMENKPIWVSDNALIAKPKNVLYSKYLFYILKENELNSMAEGSSHPLLTQEPIKSIQIFLPPELKLIEFNEQVNTWYEKTNQNKKQIQTLENLRDTLLLRLLSGEVKIWI